MVRESAPAGSGHGSSAARGQACALDFRAVYEQWFGAVCGWARSLGGPSADVEDVAQEVFLVVRRKLDGFDGRNLPGWLYRITAGKVRDARRLAWVRRLLFGGPADAGAPSTDGDLRVAPSTPEELLSRREDERTLYRLLDRLSDKRRRVLVLAEIEGLSGDEIAALENIPAATARTRLHHARRDFLELAAELRKEQS